MIITLLDLNFNGVAIIDVFESFIWTDRFNKCGDFEFYSKASRENFELFKQGYYLSNSESEHIMIIEGIEIISDTEDGNKIKVTGRSLESILDRRIVWNQTIFMGEIQNGIKTLITDAFNDPSGKLPDRKVDNFVFKESTDTRVTDLVIESSQYTGDNIYDVVTAICEQFKMGFKITLDEKKNFVFQLYFGTDRSDYQTERTVVIFSPNFDNILSSDFLNNTEPWKNVTLVAGEGEGKNRKTVVVGDAKGLNRRELYTDARDLSTETEAGTISLKVYNEQLTQRGKEQLAENKIIKEFAGEVDTQGLFKYGIDFFLGDLVHFFDEYDNGSQVRVDEMIFSWDSSGKTAYPSFEILKDDTDKEGK